MTLRHSTTSELNVTLLVSSFSISLTGYSVPSPRTRLETDVQKDWPDGREARNRVRRSPGESHGKENGKNLRWWGVYYGRRGIHRSNKEERDGFRFLKFSSLDPTPPFHHSYSLGGCHTRHRHGVRIGEGHPRNLDPSVEESESSFRTLGQSTLNLSTS